MEAVIGKVVEHSVLGAVVLAGLWVTCRVLAPLAQKAVEVTQRAIDVMEEAAEVMRGNTESNERVVRALEAWARSAGVELRLRRPQGLKRQAPPTEEER